MAELTLVTEVLPPFIEEIEQERYLGSTLKFVKETAPDFTLPFLSPLTEVPAIALFVDRFPPEDVRGMQTARYSVWITYSIMTAGADHIETSHRCQELASYFITFLSGLQYYDNAVKQMLNDDGSIVLDTGSGNFTLAIDNEENDDMASGLYFVRYDHRFQVRRVKRL